MKRIKVIIMNLVLFLGLLATAGTVYQQSQTADAYASTGTAAISAATAADSGISYDDDNDDDSSIDAADSLNTSGPVSRSGSGCGDCSTCGAQCPVKQIR